MSGHHHGHGCSHGHNHDGHEGTGRTVILNLAVNLFLTAAKWVAYAFTGSPSLFGEAAHSTGDSLNPIFQWIGHRRGQRPADLNHPYGYGRETYFWSLLAAIVMVILGAGFTAWHGIETLITGRAPERSLVAIVIMLGALVLEGYTFWRACRDLRREGGGLFERLRLSRNTVLLGILLENFVDTIAVVLAFVGFGLYWLTGNPYFDAIFSLAIAATVFSSAFFLIRRNRSLLIGEALALEENMALRQVIGNRRWVRDIVHFRTIIIGPDCIACDLKVTVHRRRFDSTWRSASQLSLHGAIAWTIDSMDTNVRQLKDDLRAADHRLKEITVEYI